MAKALRVLTEAPWPPLELAPVARAPRRAPTFRRPRVEDAAALVKFEQTLLGETPFLLRQPHEVPDGTAMAKQLAEELEQPGRFILAAFAAEDSGGRMVGSANAWREANSRMHHDAFVLVNVLREHWGCGIGRTLSARVEAWARQQGVRRLTSLVSAHNTRALRFAAALGLEQEVFSPRYTVIEGRAVDRVRVGKWLT